MAIFVSPVSNGNDDNKENPEPKYELTDEVKIFRGIPGRDEVTLYRIRALRDIQTRLYTNVSSSIGEHLLIIHEGELGGWIESKANLSQGGNCWIDKDAVVTGNAHVTGNAYVGGHAWISDNVIVTDDSTVTGSARLAHHTIVSECATVRGSAILQDDTIVSGYAVIEENAWISGDSRIHGSVVVDGFTRIKKGDISTQREVPKWHLARNNTRRAHSYI